MILFVEAFSSTQMVLPTFHFYFEREERRILLISSEIFLLSVFYLQLIADCSFCLQGKLIIALLLRGTTLPNHVLYILNVIMSLGCENFMS